MVTEATFKNRGPAAEVCFEIYVHILHGFSRQEILGEEDALPPELVASVELNDESNLEMGGNQGDLLPRKLTYIPQKPHLGKRNINFKVVSW